MILTWQEGIEKANEIIDANQRSNWELGDILVSLIPDGTPETRTLLKKFFIDTGARLKPGTLTTLRETSLAWPPHTRIDKPYWYFAQARYKPNRKDIVEEAKSEKHLRELLGHRNPYRIDWNRIREFERDNLREAIDMHYTPSHIRYLLSDSLLREKIVAELSTTYGLLYVPFRGQKEV